MYKHLLVSGCLLVSSVFAFHDESTNVCQSNVVSHLRTKNLVVLDARSPELSKWNVHAFNDYAERFCASYKAQDACNDILNDVNHHKSIIQKLYVSAAYCGEREILEKILNCTAAKDVVLNVRVIHGHTALMMAAYNNRSDCVSLLLDEEGKKQDDLGRTALMIAMSGAEAAHLLVNMEAGMTDNKGQTALMEAVKYNNLSCVRLLLDREGGMRDENSQTALMWAAQNGRTECVRLLIERERDICDKSGNTALDYARKAGNQEIVKILLGNNVA